MKNVLFLVTGMTPQIITETVWALACDPKREEPWVPDEIYVVSTKYGINQISSRLFGENSGRFEQFKRDYPILQNIAFEDNEHHLHVIKDKNGKPLTELRLPEDNEYAADLIFQKIHEFTKQDDISLHVSIAGGRKTMGFYAGYALSLYGRPQDRMSHVLVDSQYETASDFFYPTPQDNVYVISRDDIRLAAKDATIWLADIPFVRILPSLNKNNIMINKRFSEVVEIFNLSMQSPNITLDTKSRTVTINGKTCKLPPKEFSIYYLAAELAQQNQTLYYPKDFASDTIDVEHQKRYNQIYGQYKARDDVIVDNAYFSGALANITKKFRNTFGWKITEEVRIQPIENRYGIKLPICQITII